MKSSCKQNLILLFLLSGVLAPFLAADSGQEMVPLGNHLYEMLDALALEAGVQQTSRSRPWPRQQFRQFAADINPADLSDEGRAVRELLLSEPDLQAILSEDDMSLELIPRIGLEFYGRNLPWLEPVHGFNQRLPVFSLDGRLQVGDILFFAADYEVREEVLAQTRDSDGWIMANLPGKFEFFDIQSPFRSYGSIGGDFWNLSFGRDRLALGSGKMHQIQIGSSAHFYEHFQARLFWPDFSWSFQLLSLDASLDTNEVKPAGDPSRFFYNHRIDFRGLEGRLGIGLSEGLMVAGQALDIKYFAPFMVYHSFTNWTEWSNQYGGTASSFLSLDIAYIPVQYTNLYGQLVFNQFTLPNEAATGDGDTPGAFGYMGGFSASIPRQDAYWGTGIEFTRTDPWLYLRENPWKSFEWRRNALTTIGDPETGAVRTLVREPMGYSWGPDATGFVTWLEWRRVDNLVSSGLRFERVWQGENDFESAWKVDSPSQVGQTAVAMQTPTGTPEVHTLASVWATWNVQAFLTIRGGLDLHFIDQYEHRIDQSIQSFEAWAGFELRPMLISFNR